MLGCQSLHLLHFVWTILMLVLEPENANMTEEPVPAEEKKQDNDRNEVDEAERDRCSLFLGDLSIFCSEKDVEDAFSQFGEIVEVRIQRSRETARALSYGFIEFAEPACAEAALNSMNYYVLKGRPLRVGWAANRKNPIKSAVTPHDCAATVYCRFMALTTDATVSEESLRNLFSNYGPVFDCAIKKLYQDPKTNRTKGYAFVSFESGALMQGQVDVAGMDAAYQASMCLANCVVDNVRYRCELGRRLQKQYASLTQQHTYATGPGVPMAMAVPVPMAVPTVIPVMPAQGYASAYQGVQGYMPYGNEQDYNGAGGYPQEQASYQFQQQPMEQQQRSSPHGSPPSSPPRQRDYQQHQHEAQAQQQAQQQQQQQQMLSQAQLYSLRSSSFSPTHMVSQILNSNRSPSNYELQMLRALTPHAQGQGQSHLVTPQRAYNTPYGSNPAAGQQQSYGSVMVTPISTQMSGVLSPPPMQYIPQSQQGSTMQYAYPYYSTSLASTPTNANPEHGLRSRSMSSDAATAVGYSNGMQQQMMMPVPTMVPVMMPMQRMQSPPGQAYAGYAPQQMQGGYGQSPPPQYHNESAQTQSQAQAQGQGQSGMDKASTPRGSCSAHFNAVAGLELKVSTDPVAPHLSQDPNAQYMQQLASSSGDSTISGGYATRTDAARNAMYKAMSPHHVYQYMQQHPQQGQGGQQPKQAPSLHMPPAVSEDRPQVVSPPHD